MISSLASLCQSKSIECRVPVIHSKSSVVCGPAVEHFIAKYIDSRWFIDSTQ